MKAQNVPVQKPQLFATSRPLSRLNDVYLPRRGYPLYVTTPIYYVNDVPHIGHAYTTIAGDVMARFWRFLGWPTYFVTGVDEHGGKVAQSAKSKNVPAQAYVDDMAKIFRSLVQALNAVPDDFIRTTEFRHHQAAQALWKTLEDRGHIYLGTYSGWYAVRDEAFYSEDEIQDGKAPSGAPVEWVEEPCYFFKLSAWQKELLAYYQENSHAIRPKERYNETLRFIESGLKDLAISRTKLSWGISVPTHVGHVMYVWMDALTNYLTVLGYPDVEQDNFKTFWPHSVHLVGKDILRFHTVYWPAFLMAAGLKPPERVFAHGWWTREGKKMSKSLGNVLDPFALIQRYGADALRYFLLKDIRFGQDGDISEDALLQCYNQDLKNTLGNLAQRILAFIDRYCSNDFKESKSPPIDSEHEALQTWGRRALPYLKFCIEQEDLYGYIDLLQTSVQQVNAYITKFEPWKMLNIPEKASHLLEGLYSLCMFLRDIALLFSVVLPKTMEKLLQQMGEEKEISSGSIQRLGSPLSTALWPKPEPIFDLENV
ncbi:MULTISPECIES: methionine--tRNA ligase [Holospora]|uniref:Methionine--tRNA ligase n=2 Tax=Holospora TaxID=44747 RepID=A0A061JHX2_9PROT|nr:MULTISPECIES: methionine--tRNA ligase [Holospora]ETZ05033.1 methionine--tRNA ligase [Holospora undulata HU1]GAJ46292.1 methionine--tRNA ligase [Holospora elegans E1]